MDACRTIVYIDGFNLYYGALRDRPHCKWLNLWEWAECLLGTDETLVLVRYFTARVGGRSIDPGAPQRQDVYLRALTSLRDKVIVHEGHFKEEEEEWPLAPDRKERVKVFVTEEKGSDVNLATYLMLDAHEGAMDADAAMVVTDDFDLKEPLRLVREYFEKRLVVVSPRASNKLAEAVGADYSRSVQEPQLLATQFPEMVVGVDGHEIYRPPPWNSP